MIGLRATIALITGGYLIAGVAPIIHPVFSAMNRDVGAGERRE